MGCISRRFIGDHSELGADIMDRGGINRRLRGRRPELTADFEFRPSSPPVDVFDVYCLGGTCISILYIIIYEQ